MATKLFTVIGGSGFIGRTIVQKLAERGHRVRVATRHPDQAMFLKPLGVVGQVQIVQANIRNVASIERAVAGADGVINCVGILFESGSQKFDALQAQGAGIVAQAARAAGCTSFVQLSAIGADAESPSAYARSKAAGEAAVRTAFPAATVLRPAIVFGSQDGFFNRFAGIARMSPVMPVICGNSRFQPVYVGDVAEAAVRAATDPAQFGSKTFELGGPRSYSFRELLAYVLKETMRKRPLVAVPLGIAKIQAAVLGLLPNPPLTSDQLKLLARDNVATPGMPGLDAFGLSPTPVEAVVPSYLVRFRPKGQFSDVASA
jgi:uncharacterized protein YbjT (DUF2867 family)